MRSFWAWIFFWAASALSRRAFSACPDAVWTFVLTDSRRPSILWSRSRKLLQNWSTLALIAFLLWVKQAIHEFLTLELRTAHAIDPMVLRKRARATPKSTAPIAA